MNHPDCELTALIDHHPLEGTELGSLNLPYFDSLSSYFSKDGDADAVIIATPNGSHASMALEVLEHHKHVMIEKPMALKNKEAIAIIKKAGEVNRQVMVVLQNRYAPVSLWLKQLVSSGILGKLYFVEVNCFWNRDERYYKKGNWHGTASLDGGTLFTQFSHFIDTVYWLFGDIENINSRFYNFNHQHLTEFEDTGSVVFDFQNGGTGCFNFSTASWDKNVESSLTILAEHGSIKISGQYMNTIEHCHIRNYQLPSSFAQYEPSGNHSQMLHAMVKAIRNGGSTNAEEGAQTVDIIERMYAARQPNHK
jgi:predicted dehydrogenase